jgi:hypothetical protein
MRVPVGDDGTKVAVIARRNTVTIEPGMTELRDRHGIVVAQYPPCTFWYDARRKPAPESAEFASPADIRSQPTIFVTATTGI